MGARRAHRRAPAHLSGVHFSGTTFTSPRRKGVHARLRRATRGEGAHRRCGAVWHHFCFQQASSKVLIQMESNSMAAFRKLVAVCAVLTISTAAGAQTLKSGPLSLVVPFASGGPSDAAGRILAKVMAETLGQTVVVE